MENQIEKKIVVAATFTAEPIEESLNFWSRELKSLFQIEFAPYNQVFQQLLDPSSIISKNKMGMNVILIRFEDWIRNSNKLLPNLGPNEEKQIKENVKNLLLAVKSAAERSSTPYLVCICPDSPAVVSDADQIALHRKMEDLLFAEFDGVSNVYLVKTSELTDAYSVSKYYDPISDEIGHVPYTPIFFTAIGTIVARKYYLVQSTPYKVIVLDCDQTLWKGICGEDGPLGIEIDAPRRNLQEFMVRQLEAGMLICLCSKNNEEDVIEVFEHHSEMPLKRDHIISWRINWRPKSENIKALANELQLGLDSFILIDDNPIECAEVEANCPEVLTLLLPKELENIPRFLEHVWAFDHLKITEEDNKRTTLYKENIKREHFLHESFTLGDFLSGLELKVPIFEAKPNHLGRVGQLTQRTNQFNFTTIRRSEAEIQGLCQSGKIECLAVEVSDRFGDYGLVGVILFEADFEAIKIDTFLLSCRAMGRGVEHRMLARLGEIAKERGLSHVEVKYIRTKKNQPALDFLDGIGSKYKEPLENGLFFKFPTGYVEKITYIPSVEKTIISNDLTTEKSSQTSGKEMVFDRAKLERLAHIAADLNSAEQILKIIESQHHKQRPDLPYAYVAPSNEVERSIAQIWEKALNVEKIGINDDYFELGGTSLIALRIILRLREAFKVELTFSDFFTSLTVNKLAELTRDRIDQTTKKNESILTILGKIENMEENEIKKLLTEVKH
jgi:FkbH-like protein